MLISNDAFHIEITESDAITYKIDLIKTFHFKAPTLFLRQKMNFGKKFPMSYQCKKTPISLIDNCLRISFHFYPEFKYQSQQGIKIFGGEINVCKE